MQLDGEEIWLREAAVANTYHVYDRSTGRALRKIRAPRGSVVPRGLLAVCRSRSAGLYNDPDGDRTIIQIGGSRFDANDPETSVCFGKPFGGLLEILTVSHPVIGRSSVSRWAIEAKVASIVDPSYDELDASVETGIRVLWGILNDNSTLAAFKDYSARFQPPR
jgi:hypothetical protein